MKNTATAFLLLLVGCHTSETAPICANWLACYSECAPVAVKATELNEAAIVECDLLCRQELGYSAGDPALEASELHTATCETEQVAPRRHLRARRAILVH